MPLSTKLRLGARHSPAAYERTVDRLLACPQFGERMAVYWLDVVRYADSGGYHSDNERAVWLYRDYVVQAFNENEPFDRFTIEQLAGDLLPGAGRREKIASGYNRLLQTTEEGGAQAKEYTAKYAADRVRNTAAAWLGSTMGCCQCHDHKYDPFTTKDFYSFAAFFADVKEEPIKRQEETPMPTAQQQPRLTQMDRELAAAKKERAAWEAKLAASQPQWEAWIAAAPVRPAALPADVAAALTAKGSKRTAKQKQSIKRYYRGLFAAKSPAAIKIEQLQRQKAEFLAEVPTTLITEAVPPRTVRLLPRGNWQDDSGPVMSPAMPEFLGKLAVNGRPTRLGPGPLDGRAGESAGRPGAGQPAVATAVRRGAGADLRGPGHAGNAADASRAVGLAGGGAGRQRLGRKARDEANGHVANLPTDVAGHCRTGPPRSGELLARPARPLPLGRGNGPRQRPGRRRPACRCGWAARRSSRTNRPVIGAFSIFRSGSGRMITARTSIAAGSTRSGSGRSSTRACWPSTPRTREECTVDRPRSNTPLQALALLNDPTYVEAAKMFAARIVRDGGRTAPERLRYACRRALQREPTAAEADLLQELYRRHLAEYQADAKAAAALLNVGDAKPPADAQPAELAAWASVARVILNLHETIMRD